MLDNKLTAAEDSKQISTEAYNILEINTLMDKYISIAKENIETASKNGNTKTILTLTESQVNFNQDIANKVTEYLQNNGYNVKPVIFKYGYILNISW